MIRCVNQYLLSTKPVLLPTLMFKLDFITATECDLVMLIQADFPTYSVLTRLFCIFIEIHSKCSIITF